MSTERTDKDILDTELIDNKKRTSQVVQSNVLVNATWSVNKTINGLIYNNAVITTDKDVNITKGSTFINRGTIKIIGSTSKIEVFGTLINFGNIEFDKNTGGTIDVYGHLDNRAATTDVKWDLVGTIKKIQKAEITGSETVNVEVFKLWSEREAEVRLPNNTETAKLNNGDTFNITGWTGVNTNLNQKYRVLAVRTTLNDIYLDLEGSEMSQTPGELAVTNISGQRYLPDTTSTDLNIKGKWANGTKSTGKLTNNGTINMKSCNMTVSTFHDSHKCEIINNGTMVINNIQSSPQTIITNNGTITAYRYWTSEGIVDNDDTINCYDSFECQGILNNNQNGKLNLMSQGVHYSATGIMNASVSEGKFAGKIHNKGEISFKFESPNGYYFSNSGEFYNYTDGKITNGRVQEYPIFVASTSSVPAGKYYANSSFVPWAVQSVDPIAKESFGEPGADPKLGGVRLPPWDKDSWANQNNYKADGWSYIYYNIVNTSWTQSDVNVLSLSREWGIPEMSVSQIIVDTTTTATATMTNVFTASDIGEGDSFKVSGYTGSNTGMNKIFEVTAVTINTKTVDLKSVNLTQGTYGSATATTREIEVEEIVAHSPTTATAKIKNTTRLPESLSIGDSFIVSGYTGTNTEMNQIFTVTKNNISKVKLETINFNLSTYTIRDYTAGNISISMNEDHETIEVTTTPYEISTGSAVGSDASDWVLNQEVILSDDFPNVFNSTKTFKVYEKYDSVWVGLEGTGMTTGKIAVSSTSGTTITATRSKTTGESMGFGIKDQNPMYAPGLTWDSDRKIYNESTNRNWIFFKNPTPPYWKITKETSGRVYRISNGSYWMIVKHPNESYTGANPEPEPEPELQVPMGIEQLNLVLKNWQFGSDQKGTFANSDNSSNLTYSDALTWVLNNWGKSKGWLTFREWGA